MFTAQVAQCKEVATTTMILHAIRSVAHHPKVNCTTIVYSRPDSNLQFSLHASIPPQLQSHVYLHILYICEWVGMSGPGLSRTGLGASQHMANHQAP